MAARVGEFALLYRVKYLLAIAIFICSVSDALGQNENWDTYLAKFDGKPGSIMVDLAQFDKAPDKRYPFLVITGPQARSIDKNGIPDKEEIDALEGVLDATTSFLTGVTAEVLTGTFTYNGKRVNYYYVRDTMGVRTAVQRLYNRNYKEYKYVLTIKSDPQWLTYLTFLYPSEQNQNWMENEKIMAGMLEKGDSLTRKRNIVFQTLFKTDTARSAFMDFVLAHGYKTEKMATVEKISSPYVYSFYKYDAVKMDSLSVWTDEIKQQVKSHDGLYSGWTAPLFQSDNIILPVKR